MDRVEKTVFLSYRRTNFPWALAIYQSLTHHGYDVFFDYKGVSSGDFEQVILGNITSRAHFLVLLTPSALERCNEPGDWLRREIETALANRRNVVPLLVENFDFGAPGVVAQLTGELSVLKHYQGVRIPEDYFDEAMDRLRNRHLNLPLTSIPHPASAAAKHAATEQKVAANAAPQVPKEELTAQQWFERGFAATDPDEKVRCYSEAIRLKPDYVDAYNNRGIARYDRGDIDGAIKDYNEAIRLKPDYAEAYNNRGNARRLKGDLDGAVRDYNEAIRLKPNYADPYSNRGIARRGRGEIDSAIKDYNEAIRLKPDHANAYKNRGIVLQQKSDYAAAVNDFSRYLQLGGGAQNKDQSTIENTIRDLKKKL